VTSSGLGLAEAGTVMCSSGRKGVHRPHDP